MRHAHPARRGRGAGSGLLAPTISEMASVSNSSYSPCWRSTFSGVCGRLSATSASRWPAALSARSASAMPGTSSARRVVPSASLTSVSSTMIVSPRSNSSAASFIAAWGTGSSPGCAPSSPTLRPLRPRACGSVRPAGPRPRRSCASDGCSGVSNNCIERSPVLKASSSRSMSSQSGRMHSSMIFGGRLPTRSGWMPFWLTIAGTSTTTSSGMPGSAP